MIDRPRFLALLLLLTLLVSGCAAGRGSYSSGIEAFKDAHYDLAVAELSKALKAAPDNAEYPLAACGRRLQCHFFPIRGKSLCIGPPTCSGTDRLHLPRMSPGLWTV